MDPALRTVHAHADAGREHEQQQDEREQQQLGRVTLDPVELGARGAEREQATECKEHEVAEQVVERPDLLVVGHRNRTRGDHDRAETGQRDRRDDDAAVITALRRAASGGLRVGVHGGHQRTFNVARPTSTSTTLMIQKRTITRGSGQPLSSKW